MIIFQLRCDNDHGFEGWFGDSQDYQRQHQEGLIACPVCASAKVEKVLSGVPFLKKASSPREKASSSGTCPQKPASAPAPIESLDAFRKKRDGAKASLPSESSQSSETPIGKTIHLDPVMLLKGLENHVRLTFEDVGKGFYDEVMKMENKEAPVRKIYGEATTEQREKLDEHNVAYTLIPKLGPQYEN